MSELKLNIGGQLPKYTYNPSTGQYALTYNSGKKIILDSQTGVWSSIAVQESELQRLEKLKDEIVEEPWIDVIRTRANIMLAWCNGAKIQVFEDDEWIDQDEPNFYWDEYEYRIKND